MNTLPIAEIRGVIAVSNNGYPITVHGATSPYMFSEDRAGGKYVRRYVAEGVDPDKGRHPLAEALAAMKDLQAGKQTAFKITWELVTEAEFVAARDKAAAEAAAARADEEAQQTLIAAKEAEKEKVEKELAEARIGLPSQPSAAATDKTKPKAGKKALGNLGV